MRLSSRSGADATRRRLEVRDAEVEALRGLVAGLKREVAVLREEKRSAQMEAGALRRELRERSAA